MVKDKAKDKDPATAPSEPEVVEVVEFVGPGREVTIRILEDQDFVNHGMEGVGKKQWDSSNNWRIPMEEFRGVIPQAREFFASLSDFVVEQREVVHADPEDA